MDIDKALLLDVRYSGEFNKPYCKFYDLDEDKIKIWYDTTNYKPYCLAKYVRGEEAKRLEKNNKYLGYKTIKKYNPMKEKEEEYNKLFVETPYDIGGKYGIRSDLQYTWEDNIRFHHNYLYDTQLKVGMVYKIKNNEIIKKQKETDKWEKYIRKLFKDDKEQFFDFGMRYIDKLTNSIPKTTKLAMDIEIDEDKKIPDVDNPDKKVISIAFKSNDGLDIVFLLKRKSKSGSPDGFVKFFDTEKGLISKAFSLIKKYPLLITYNGDNFDLPYLYKRGEKIGITDFPFTIKKGWGWKSKYEAYLNDGIHIDLYNFFSNRSIRVYSFQSQYDRNSLDSVSEALLDSKKIKVDSIPELDYKQLTKYNRRDADLTLRLADKKDVWETMILLCRITNLPISSMLRYAISNWIKSILYDEHRKRNWIIPKQENIFKQKGADTVNIPLIEGKLYRGGFVIEPKPGVHFKSVVMDFASLYPSIMKEYNISYETINCGHDECKDNKIPTMPHYTCKKKAGILSYIVGFFRDIRVDYFKPKGKTNDFYKTIEQTLKVFINGAYGVFGNKNFQFFCVPVAESITSVGWNSIKKTIKKCEKIGVNVLYGDTDSVFLDNPTDKQMKEISEWSTKELHLDLEKEKTYQILALSDRKKNYVGIKMDGEKDIKGLVGKKRNTPPFIKKSIKKFINHLKLINNKKEYKKHRNKLIKRVQKAMKGIGKPNHFPLQDYAVNVKLSKDPSKYKKTTPQHVKAVRRSGKKYEKNEIVTYIKTKDSVGAKLLQDAEFRDLDIKKYNELFRSAFEQVLDAFGINWQRILGFKKVTDFT